MYLASKDALCSHVCPGSEWHCCACRYFQRSCPTHRYCPFGKDCFYQQLNEDGTIHEFTHGVEQYSRSGRPSTRVSTVSRLRPVHIAHPIALRTATTESHARTRRHQRGAAVSRRDAGDDGVDPREPRARLPHGRVRHVRLRDGVPGDGQHGVAAAETGECTRVPPPTRRCPSSPMARLG